MIEEKITALDELRVDLPLPSLSRDVAQKLIDALTGDADDK